MITVRPGGKLMAIKTDGDNGKLEWTIRIEMIMLATIINLRPKRRRLKTMTVRLKMIQHIKLLNQKQRQQRQMVHQLVLFLLN